ncbi:uncharacterized protein LOC123439333 isoform X2 [Hordeum vulgare subsp. vulgare]|uniref:uncharacterized protein LOC123439333 isoform X2 n=1 Tax=Hordeum vulgare subsp. vulgare TaxID=112509 RepID=UPI001D1A4DC2|nr:uncharacterized protein LOC123439333 isoform X2 [Hordeum vulgare subsp. vulgare]
MAILKKNTSFAVAALVVVMAATLLLSSCDARKEMDKLTAFPVPGKCYSRYFPNCTEPRCKKFCFQPIPGAVCTDKNTCCCPIA